MNTEREIGFYGFLRKPFYCKIMDGFEVSDSLSDSDEDLNSNICENVLAPRSYQEELFKHALDKNSILVLGTGSGKTLISILLIKELGDKIRGSLDDGAERTVFLVNTVPLVYQQANAIERQTGFKVGRFEGSMGVDNWPKETWDSKLNESEVLVMVAQIFYDLINANKLELSKINLLILDECHHATGSHPMREVMRKYFSLKKKNHKVPRILGLTACVILKKCTGSKVYSLMRDLENVMDSVLVTSYDQETVKAFTTKPKEWIIKYLNAPSSSRYECFKAQLMEIESMIIKEFSDLLENDRCQKLKKFVKKHIRAVHEICDDLGDYVFPKALQLQADYLEDLDADDLNEQTVGRVLSTKLRELHSSFDSNDVLNTHEFLSPKVKKLLEILGQPSREKICILVFVQRRNTAKLLCSLLLELRNLDPALQYLNPECVVGGALTHKFDLRVAAEEMKKQKVTIERFRQGVCNLIVSTSVLEEGMDVRKCNLVVRFDAPLNYQSYIQSLGRARAVPSNYMTLIEENKAKDLEETYTSFKQINATLNELCHQRQLPTTSEMEEHFADEKEPPFSPYGELGPQITFYSAIQLLNKYCGTLPQDKFTKLNITVNKKRDQGKIIAELTLPINAPFRGKIAGNPMDNLDDAKKSAALKMCKKLFKMGLLNSHLLPLKSSQKAEEDAKKYINHFEEAVGKVKPGTKKRRQIYKRQICKAFKRNNGGLHLHLVYFQHIERISDDGLLFDNSENTTQLGLLCGEKLNCSPFPLYSKKWGQVNILVEYVKQVNNYGKLEDVKLFHNTLSQMLLKIDLNLLKYNPDKIEHSIFYVPLNKNKEIDTGVLQSLVTPKNAIEHHKKQNGGKDFVFDEKKFEKGVIVPSYRDSDLMYVDKIVYDESPSSPFPENKKSYKSYKDYMEKEYDAIVHVNDQPLLDCKHFSKEFNFLPVEKAVAKVSQSKHPKFIPELCIAFPVSSSFWAQVLCLPSIVHRINGLQLEQELFKTIGFPTKESDTYNHRFWDSVLYYNWLEVEVKQIVERNKNQLHGMITELEYRKTMFIHPGMLLQALTPIKTRENFNLERLEVFGDSYLKFAVGQFLYYKEVSSHEGTLTIQRSRIVSNAHLYLLAKEKGLSNMFQGVMLSPATAIPYGFEVPAQIEARFKQEQVAHTNWTSASVAQTGATTSESEADEESYNLWSEQLIPDKSVADSVEALIGVYLLTGGEGAANHLLKWLGFNFLNERVVTPKTAVSSELPEKQVFTSLNSLYQKNCLDRLEGILGYTFKEKSFLVQAVTHPSCISNKVTDCYQRLEFLGDAVLDYLITSNIFFTYSDFNPGQLTDLRSHYVKNETLAKVSIKFKLHKFLLHFAPKLPGTIEKFEFLVEEGENDLITERDAQVAEDVEVPKALGDIVESLIGAVYLDSGKSFEVTWKLIERLLKDELTETRTNIPIDSVRELHERDPNVVLDMFPPSEEDGNAKCIVMMKGFPPLTGFGKNKRSAKQAACKLALNRIVQAAA